MVDSNTRQAKRTPVTLKVKFKSETLDQFIERYAVDVSQGGIFIRTKEPQPVGTQMKFEFQLRDGAPLIGGEGTVVWIREPDPSRPAVAPGMGVRFDRLADGSMVVLERILNQKSRIGGGGSRPSAKTPAFNETPTRVAQVPMTDEERENTPQPSPMPFHSDADEFPDEAFEEATKVRSVEDLVVQTAMSTADLPLPAPPASSPTIATPATASGQLSPLGFQPPAGTPPFASHMPARESDLPRTLIDAAPPPAAAATRTIIESVPPPVASRTLLDAAPPPPPVQASSPSIPLPPAELRPRAGETVQRAEPMRAREPSKAPPLASAVPAPPISALPAPRESKTTLLVIAVLCLVVAAGALAWFLFLRKPGTSATVVSPSGSATSQPPVAPPNPPPAQPSQPANPPPTQPTQPAAEQIATIIETGAVQATVAVDGTDQRGNAPFTAKLEKGKTYNVKVTAPGFVATELTVIGGNDTKVPVKLEAKPRVLEVNSTPGQASVYLDGIAAKRSTPANIELTAAQSTRKLRLMVRRVGYQPFFVTIKPEDFSEESDRMLYTVNASLTTARAAPPPPPSDGGGEPPPPSGDSGGGEAPPPPDPAPKPEAAPSEPSPSFQQ